ncbi:hypothetical protein ACE6H2_028362 [Prunus campanulata]
MSMTTFMVFSHWSSALIFNQKFYSNDSNPTPPKQREHKNNLKLRFAETEF